MKILAWPAYKNKESNPYNWMLYSEIAKNRNVVIEEFSVRRLLLNKIDIIHIHWPENFLNKKNTIKTSFNMIFFFTLIFMLKIKRVKIIWTAHNIFSHEEYHPYLEKIFWTYFLKNIDACICPTHVGEKELINKHKSIRNIKRFTIYLGHYKEAYKNNLSKEEARKILGIKNSDIVLLNLGKIREYKGLIELIEEFKKINQPSYLLYIVGESKNKTLEENIKKRLNNKIKFIPKLIHSDKIQQYINSADLLILPYRKIFNSGAVLLALSFNKPVLVPKTSTFKEIQGKIGSKWIKTYEGELNMINIKEGIKWAIEKRIGKPNINIFNWDKIAKETIRAYKEIKDYDKK